MAAALITGIFPAATEAGYLSVAMGAGFLSAAAGAGFLAAATGAGFLAAVQDTGRPSVTSAAMESMLMHLRSGPPLVHEEHDTQLLEEDILVGMATCCCKDH